MSTLAILQERLKKSYPGLRIAGAVSPPFRKLDHNEEREIVKTIRELNADFVFVGLGCPKQETWMARNYEQLDSVLLGVGAAFDFMAGTVKRPPKWMRRTGLEWFGRLLSEPSRLWHRYLVTNSLFI